jgi:hypothetical protein
MDNFRKLFNEEERDDLAEFAQSDNCTLLIKLAKCIALWHERDVLRYNLDTGSPEGLVRAKAELDGIQKFAAEFEGYLKDSKGSEHG